MKTEQENNVSKRGNISDTKCCLILYFVVFIIMFILGGLLSVSYILDETGTVANAAFLAGYNWSDWVNSTGGYYYKYGQAPFYFIVFKIFSNPYIIYKALLIINGFIYAFTPVFIYKVLRYDLEVEDKLECALISFMASILPASILYSLFVRADVMLITLSWIILYFTLQCVKHTDRKKQSIYAALTGFASVYAYMCHSRGIVFVIAVFMLLFFVRYILKEKKIRFSIYLVSVICWMLLDKLISRFFKDSIWRKGVRKNTISSINTGKFDGIFTKAGIKTIINHASGWLFSSFSGTYGLAILGLLFSVVIFIYYFTKKKNVNINELIISVYSLLVYCGTLAMGSLFSFRSNYNFVTGKKLVRSDRFVYSRYLVVIYSVLVFVAVY